MSNDEIRKNIGHATSYGYAKSTGRLPEGMDEDAYAELMADYVTVGQTAVAAKNAAVAAKDAAETAAGTATTKAAEASQSATTATNAANAAQADADAAALDASQAMSAASTATTKASEASQSATTATNAKNDAVTAKTAAQAAQTAAETAEDNAETSATAAAASAASVAGSAAQIQTNAEDISQLKSDLSNNISFESGSLNSWDGLPAEAYNNRVRTVSYIPKDSFGYFMFKSNLRCAFFAYNDSQAKLASSNWIVSNDIIYTLQDIADILDVGAEEIKYIKIILRKTDDSIISSVSEIEPYISYESALSLSAEKSIFNGKTISIYGDSISTFAGWIPTGNATYYNGNNAGINNVNETWWKKIINVFKMDLVVNNSWSGRAVSSIRDNVSGHTTDAGYKESNVLQLKNGNTLPNIIIIKLGINDFNSGALLGDYDGSTALPTDPTKFLDAYAIMLNLIMTNFPLADVYCCTLMQCERTGSKGFPEINSNGDSINEWNAAIAKLAHAFGAKVLHHDVCGITYYNMSTYMGDYSDGAGLHPNANGHSLIANQTINEMDNAVRTRF